MKQIIRAVLLSLVIGFSAFWGVSCVTSGGLTTLPATATSTARSPQSFGGTPSPLETQNVNLPVVVSGAAQPSATPTPTKTVTPQPTLASVIFAVIGDYGLAGQPEADVAQLVKSWQPDFILTTGDNNYPQGGGDTIDENIGRYYHGFIAPYVGSFGSGAQENRFFPSLGNHDWMTANANPYLDYFVLPGNERYYDFSWGPIHFFAIDGDSREPDGVGSSSKQALWLRENLATAIEPWKIVYSHFPPYSSGLHGSVEWARWPFQEWGATAMIAGHDHTYERLLVDGFPYFVNGAGGGPLYPFVGTLPGSQVRYNQDYGAMKVEATDQWISFSFITRQGEIIDTYQMNQPTQ